MLSFPFPKESSFIRNKGAISFSHLDSGLFGKVRNNGRLEAYKHTIKKHNLPLNKVVDVGCSYGSWAKNYRKLGFEKLYGIDVNEDVVEQAQEVFDDVYHADAKDLHKFFPNSALVAANGVLIHILEKKEVLRFFKGIRKCLAESGCFLFTVVNSDYYISPNGYKPWVGENACTHELSYFDDLLAESKLKAIDKIGTFIDPWCVEPFRFLARHKKYKEDERLYNIFASFANLLREKETHELFSEVLYLVKKSY